MPLVSVLPILQPLLLAFAAVFSKPQQRHFDNYIQGLIVQDHRRTLAGMSRHVLERPDASSWDRFVTTAPWELPALNDRWRRWLRQELRRLQPVGVRIAGRQTDFLLADDPHHLRTGKHLEGAGYHYLHTEQRTRWSHCLVVTAYRTGDYTLAYSGEAYVREADLAPLDAERQRQNLLRDPPERLPSGGSAPRWSKWWRSSRPFGPCGPAGPSSRSLTVGISAGRWYARPENNSSMGAAPSRATGA